LGEGVRVVTLPDATGFHAETRVPPWRSNAASFLRVTPPAAENSPPTNSRPPRLVIARTLLFMLGLNDFSAPLAASTAARRLRAVVFTDVKVPPM
jgi:hypothetical protein